MNLSVLAERLQAHETNSAQHSARLEQLSAAYRAGSYAPDAGSVSDKLIEEALTTPGNGESGVTSAD